MQQRDLLKDPIEQLGRVLGKIIAGWLDLKLQGRLGAGIEWSVQNLKEQLDIDVEELMELRESDLLAYLEERNLIGAHAETIADFLRDIGTLNLPTDPEKGKKYLNNAIDLYETANQLSNTLSLERIQKKIEVEEMLRQSNEKNS